MPALLPFLVLTVPTAHAGERLLAWSYGAATVPKGQVELEPFSTVETHQEGGSVVAEWTHEVEVEAGLTSGLEAGMYLVAAQTDDGPLRMAGYKARLRYRFWPLGTRAVDLAAYLEYVGTPTFDEHELEAKLIVAHEGKRVYSSLNLTVEMGFDAEGVVPVLEPTAGVAWRFSPAVAIGAEAKLETVFGETVEGPMVWAGPTLHLAGPESRIWWTISGLYGLTDETRNDAIVEARSMVGIDL